MTTGENISFKDKVLKGFLWLGTGTLLAQLITWLSTIFVIRLLLPADYGLMAMAFTFIALLTVISELGISASIIQAEEINDREIRQIFGLTILMSVMSLVICYLGAPFLGKFYHETNLVKLIRVMSITFLLTALYIIPQSLLIREMNFKAKAKIDILAQVGSSILTLILALVGMGVWSLVFGFMTLHSIKAAGFNLVGPSWVQPIFHFKGAERYIKFGLTVTGDRLLYYMFTQSDKIVVGKLLGDNLLGIYTVALTLASIPAEKVLPIITQVSFTSYSRIQDDIERINRNILRAIRIISFVGFPIFFGMAGVAKDGIPLILGPKWTSIVLPFQLLCIILPLKALSPILPPAVFAIGKPKVNLANMAITSIAMSAAFLIGVKAGLLGVCSAWIVAYPGVFLFTSSRCLKALDLSLKVFLSEIYFPLLASVIMLFSIYLFEKMLIRIQPLPSLIILVIFGGFIFLSLVFLFRRKEILELKALFQR